MADRQRKQTSSDLLEGYTKRLPYLLVMVIALGGLTATYISSVLPDGKWSGYEYALVIGPLLLVIIAPYGLAVLAKNERTLRITKLGFLLVSALLTLLNFIYG